MLARVTVRFVLAALATLAAPSALAQSPATAIVRGTVLDRAGGAPIADVSVQIQELDLATRTDTLGRFEFAAVPTGRRTLYVSIVGFILVKRTLTLNAGDALDVTILLTEGTGTYSEEITVTGDAFVRQERAVAVQQTLGSGDIQNLRNLLTNDPMRAIQVLPGVTSGDDFRSEFAVRGSPFGRMNFTLDGISSPFLLHTVQQVVDGGSIAMVNGDVLGGITLMSGSYPQRFGNRLGAELDFMMREGSRDRTQVRAGISGTDASLVVEGPFAGRKGSWLVSGRKSYLDLLVRQISDDLDFGFGFADTQARLAYDATTTHRFELSLVAGRSRLDRISDTPAVNRVSDGRNASSLATLAWRYAVAPSAILTQRIGLAHNKFSNRNDTGSALGDGHGRDVTWRSDVVLRAGASLTVEAGTQAQWQARGTRSQLLLDDNTIRRIVQRLNGEGSMLSTYAQATWSPAARWVITPGVLVDRWSVSNDWGMSPWLQAEYRFDGNLTARAGTGLHRQAPGLEESAGLRAGTGLREERAYHADLALEHVLGDTRWQVAVYNREERDLLRLPSSEPHVDAGLFVNASSSSTWANALDGYARGVELLLQRRAVRGISGWVSYSLGFNRYRDRITGETFDGDFDQRHAVNVYAHVRVTDRFSLAAKLRAGSNVPATGYWNRQGADYFVGTVRNGLRVPAYSRLDVRGSRVFNWRDRRLTLFVEAMNLLARDNVRFNPPSVDPRTQRAFGIFESMIPLVPSAGVLIEF
jgi:hypothetical protein